MKVSAKSFDRCIWLFNFFLLIVFLGLFSIFFTGKAQSSESPIQKPRDKILPAENKISTASSSCHLASVSTIMKPEMVKTPAWEPISMSVFQEIVAPKIDWLFEHGLDDPAGAEYREFSVEIGSVWSTSGYWEKTRGWALPEKVGMPREGIAWNGLRYEIASLGQVVDLASDVREVTRQAIESNKSPYGRISRISYLEGHPLHGQTLAIKEFRPVLSESATVDPIRPRLMKVALLYRAGFASESLHLWNGIFHGCNNVASNPFLILTMEATWNLFDRAVCAHKRGDDKIALRELRKLVPLAKTCREIQKRENLRFRNRYYLPDDKIPDDFAFTNPAESLLKDQERRYAERINSNSFVPLPRLASFTGKPWERWRAELELIKKAKVPTLIRWLQEVAITQDGQPGGCSPKGSKVVRALISKGDAAIDPLIECLENDERLSRTVTFGRDFHSDRSIWPARSFASYALAAVVGFNSLVKMNDNRPTKEEYLRLLKEFMRKFRGMSREEMYYQILKDDDSSWDQWIESAHKLTQEVDEDLLIGGGLQWVSVPNRIPGKKVPLRGDLLKCRVYPSIENLLKERIRFFEEKAKVKDQISRGRAMEKVKGIESRLTKWNPSLAKNLLERLSREFQEVKGRKTGWELDEAQEWLGSRMMNIAHSTRRAGYPGVMPVLASWAYHLSPEPQRRMNYMETSYVVRFLLDHLDEPCVRNWLRTITSRPAWSKPLLQLHPLDPSILQLAGKTIVRAIALTGIFNHKFPLDKEFGKTRMVENDRFQREVEYSIGTWKYRAKQYPFVEGLCPPKGITSSFSISDLAYELISRLLEIGPFRVSWDPILRRWGKTRIREALGIKED
jgi:hypothetical protein